MARRKSADWHMRADPTNLALWRLEAQRQRMSLASLLEALANREVLDRRQERRLEAMYPGRYRNPVDEHVYR
jgi:hypothetical protein